MTIAAFSLFSIGNLVSNKSLIRCDSDRALHLYPDEEKSLRSQVSLCVTISNGPPTFSPHRLRTFFTFPRLEWDLLLEKLLRVVVGFWFKSGYISRDE